MLRLLDLNRINFLVKRSLVLLTLLGSVFLIFNSPSNVYAEDSSASLTVTGNFNIDLTPQGTEQIMLRASGMQATAKTTSVAGYSLYASGGDENGNFVNEKASNSILKPINGSAYYSFAADQINIWGFCYQYYDSTTQCSSSYFPIGKPSTPTLLKKSDTATPTDGYTYKANLFARANQQIVSGKYIGDITYSLIVNEEISSTLVTGREFNKLLREAVNTTDPTILNDPKSELPVYINNLTFAKTEPTATSKKTVKISTENSEEPVYLTAVQSSTNSYALTIWSNAHHIYTNADSSYMFSGLNSVSTGLFYNWPNDGQVSFSKTKDFSYMFYKLGNVNESASYNIKYSSNMVNSIAKANPTNLDSMFELSNLEPYVNINTTGPVSTNSMFKNNGKRKYSVSLSGNFLENSSDMTSFFEGSNIEFSYGIRTATENFGKYTTSTNSMYKNSESNMINFEKATFSVLEDAESMFESYGGYYNSIRYLPNKSNISRPTKMKSMFKNLKTGSYNYLNLSSFNTENVTDMSYLFGSDTDNNSKQIDSLILGPNFDTKNVTNMEGMFSRISYLGNLDLGDKFDTSKVTNMAKMFYANSVETFKIGNKFNTENVTDMNMMFAGCRNMKDFNLSGFNTKNVTNMYAMFSNAGSLRNFINTSGFNTEKVTNMSYMFNGTRFEKLDLSSFNTKNVTDMSYMFNDYFSYSPIITYPAVFDTSKVTNMAYMFNNSYVRYLPSAGFDTRSVTNMNHMFSESLVNSLPSSGFNTSAVTDMGFMFYKAKYMQGPQAFNFNTRNVTNMESMFDQAFTERPSQEAIFGADFNTEKVTNVVNMFRTAKIGKADLTNFVGLPEATSLQSFFDSVPVTELILPNPFNTSKVTTMERAFFGLTSLPDNYTLNMPLATENVTNMTYMFAGCYAGNINLSSFNTEKVTDFKYMFNGNRFKTLNINNFNLEKAENINYMFDGSQLLTELDLSHIKTTNALKTMYYTFHNMKKVVTISIPGFDTSGTTDMYGAFYENPELTTIYTSEKFVPAVYGVTYYNSTDRLFADTPKLVGGAGTRQNNYDSFRTYARIDDPSSGKPGYFTYKAAP